MVCKQTYHIFVTVRKNHSKQADVENLHAKIPALRNVPSHIE